MIDLALLVLADNRMGPEEEILVSEMERWEVPYLVIHNKSDRIPADHELKEKVHKSVGKDIG